MRLGDFGEYLYDTRGWDAGRRRGMELTELEEGDVRVCVPLAALVGEMLAPGNTTVSLTSHQI